MTAEGKNGASKGRELRGVALADARNKTVKILVERLVKHALLGKTMRMHKRLLVHDPAEVCRKGDRVVVRESRPISKRKAHVLVRKSAPGGAEREAAQ